MRRETVWWEAWPLVTLHESIILSGLGWVFYAPSEPQFLHLWNAILDYLWVLVSLHYYMLRFWVITRLTPLRTEFVSFTYDPSARLALCKADTFQSSLFHLHPYPQAHDAIQGHPQCWENNLIPVHLSHLNVKSVHSIWSPFDHKGLEVELWYLVITGSFRAGRLL